MLDAENRRLKPYLWAELSALPKRRPLIKGILDLSALSIVYGESNCGKTFFVIDAALHMVLGRNWQDLKTKQGKIVYVACEGGLGIQERLEAFRVHNKIEGYGSFYLIPTGIDLCNSESDTAELTSEIGALGDVELIVIDTLSRAMGGGNENSSDDMGAFIRNCDVLRENTGAHVLIVHHAGKDTSKGARGHSALRAAVDTEIEVTNDDGLITAEIRKQRDGKTGVKFHFQLQTVNLGKDEDGDDLFSCVLVPTDEAPKSRIKLSPQRRKALEIIRTCIIDKGQKRHVRQGMCQVRCITMAECKEALRLGNISASDEPDHIRRAIAKVISDLQSLNIISTYGDYVWIPEQKE